jgi:hypothetical protein
MEGGPGSRGLHAPDPFSRWMIKAPHLAAIAAKPKFDGNAIIRIIIHFRNSPIFNKVITSLIGHKALHRQRKWLEINKNVGRLPDAQRLIIH